jgi:hypothetical protein
VTADDTAEGVLLLVPLLLALLLFILRRHGLEPAFIRRLEERLQEYSHSQSAPDSQSALRHTAWTKMSVAAKVELSVVKRSNKLRFFGELAILLVIAFFAAEILTNTRFVRDEAFIWILIGLPTCFLLGRFWWRKYR